MKKILLISNYMSHYREKIYNYFAKSFLNDGFEFHVASDEFQEAGYTFAFKQHIVPMNTKKYCGLISEINPSVVIVFLHLKDKIQVPVVSYCNTHGIPVIFCNSRLRISEVIQCKSMKDNSGSLAEVELV